MKIVEQSHEILNISDYPLMDIEKVARTCYQSQEKIRPGSAETLVTNLLSRKHEAMIEFADMTVRFITNRGVSHELVRHRLCSFAQESTRYVKYDGGMEVIKPVWWEESSDSQKSIWSASMVNSETCYQSLLKKGWKPQQAREVLPNALKTEINVKANFREWRTIFKLRTAKTAHPQMHELMRPLALEVQKLVPIIFDDIEW